MNTKISKAKSLASAPREDRARKNALKDMGTALRNWRELVAKQTQEELGQSLGVVRSTVQEMEKGSAGVAIGTWMLAWQRMGRGRLQDVVDVATPRNELDVATASMIAADAERRLARRPG
jgi:DNA-binding XRE family transcriptional regulator